MIGDGAGAPLDQGVTTVLFVVATILGWVGVMRLSGRAYRRLPRRAAVGSAAGAAACLLLALVLPPIIRPDTAVVRPSTRATLSVVSPRPGQVFTGNPATVPIRLRLTGGRIVRTTSMTLVPNEGHIHLFIDDGLVSMAFGLTQEVRVAPGRHVLTAEFVAVDHAPFDPRVRRSVAFRVVP